jgi:hypothetical protein
LEDLLGRIQGLLVQQVHVDVLITEVPGVEEAEGLFTGQLNLLATQYVVVVITGDVRILCRIVPEVRDLGVVDDGDVLVKVYHRVNILQGQLWSNPQCLFRVIKLREKSPGLGHSQVVVILAIERYVL